MADLSVFGRLKSKDDYDREAEEFALRRKILQSEVKKNSMAATGQDVAAVKEWNYYSQLPEQDQKRYLQMKRADQIMNLGGTMSVRNPLGGVQETYTVTPKISETPEFRAAVDAQSKSAEIEAERIAEAQASVGRVTAQATEAKNLIKALKEDKGFSAVVGQPNIFKGQVPFIGAIPGSPAASAQARINQIKGKNFLQAFESLKGGGAITQIEGEKATAAIARMDQAQSEADFTAALDDLESVINIGLERIQSMASRQPRTFGAENPVYDAPPMDSLDIPVERVNTPGPPAPGAMGQKKKKNLNKIDSEATLFNARKALKKGADPQAVRARLIENGIDPSKAGL